MGMEVAGRVRRVNSVVPLSLRHVLQQKLLSDAKGHLYIADVLFSVLGAHPHAHLHIL